MRMLVAVLAIWSAALAAANAQNGCGDTLNWTSPTCQTIGSGQLNSAIVNGVSDPNAWTVISRHGEYGQNETECNIPSQIGIGGGILTITTKSQSTSCGDWESTDGGTSWPVGHAPSSFPYLTGDVQWNTLNFQYGTVEIRGRMPSDNTKTWPAWWLQDSRCQTSNKYTGDTGYGGCPNISENNYREIDVVECYDSSGTNPNYWCQFHVANPSFGIGGGCDIGYAVDTNYHTWQLRWTAVNLSRYLDGTLMNGPSGCNQAITGPLFFIDQIQTGGIAGTPANLPTTTQIDWIKVCDQTLTPAACDSASPTAPGVIFYDDFNGIGTPPAPPTGLTATVK